jgi:hypothetical protein
VCERSQACWSAAWTPTPVPSRVRLARSALCTEAGHPEAAALARWSSGEDGRPSASWLGFERLPGRARNPTRLQKPSSGVRPETTARKRGSSGLAQRVRARWCKKASTPVFSSWPGGGTERPTRAGLRAGTATGSSMGKGTLIRESPPRWRVGGRKRKRRVTRKREARDRECQRSSVSSARGRQRRGEVVNHLPFGARQDGPKLLARRQPQRDPRRKRCKARTAVAIGREVLGRRGAAQAPPQGIGRIPCAREWSRLQKSMEASSSGPGRLTAQRSSE